MRYFAANADLSYWSELKEMVFEGAEITLNIKRYGEANNATYSFRLQLAPSILWGPTLGPLTAKVCLMASYAVTYLLKHRDGRDNLLGRIARSMLKRSHRSHR